jgi:hypothetical protein
MGPLVQGLWKGITNPLDNSFTFPNINLPWPLNGSFGIEHFLPPLRNPACHPGDSEHYSKHIYRNANGTEHYT